jgi:hypothetical protein
VEVVINIFSGRPNPRWKLTVEESEKLLEELESLQAMKEYPQTPEGLGYQGITVRNKESAMTYDEITAVSGVVIAQEGITSRYFSDRDQKLELWLLETGKDKLETTLYHTILTLITDDKRKSL